jgi:hypothetical protein
VGFSIAKFIAGLALLVTIVGVSLVYSEDPSSTVEKTQERDTVRDNDHDKVANERKSYVPGRMDLSRYTWGSPGAESLSAIVMVHGSTYEVEALGVHLNRFSGNKYTAIMSVEQYHAILDLKEQAGVSMIPSMVGIFEPQMMKLPPPEHDPVEWVPARTTNCILKRVEDIGNNVEDPKTLNGFEDMTILVNSDRDVQQINDGIRMLEADKQYRHFIQQFTLQSADLPIYAGSDGVDSWSNSMRRLLNETSTSKVDVVFLSWDTSNEYTKQDIDDYLLAVNQLEKEYSHIIFVYCTGWIYPPWEHELHSLNNRIRWFCDDSNKVLLDFVYMETFDPEGTYSFEEDSNCSWCEDWCATHECPECEQCKDSHCLISYQKSKVFLWLLERIAEQ